MKNTRKLTIVALFIALSVVGAYIKIPSPSGTVALDAVPGYVASIYLGLTSGSIVGAIGHLISAATVGFPFGLPVHLIVALTMVIAMFAYGRIYKKNKIVACIIAVLINVPIGLIPFGLMMGWSFYMMMLPSLTIAATVNVILATIILKYIKKNA